MCNHGEQNSMFYSPYGVGGWITGAGSMFNETDLSGMSQKWAEIKLV